MSPFYTESDTVMVSSSPNFFKKVSFIGQAIIGGPYQKMSYLSIR